MSAFNSSPLQAISQTAKPNNGITLTVDQILHSIFALAITAATIFVKNQQSQQHAASIINLTNSLVLPVADSLLNPQSTFSQNTTISQGL